MPLHSMIDCHTHAYPEEAAADPRGWAADRGESYWAELVAPEGRPSIQDWSTLPSMLQAMDAADVKEAVLLGWYWENEATCRWHNAFMADWIGRSNGRIHGFASIHPNENVVEQLEVAQSLGFCGVGEMHIGVQGLADHRKAWQLMAEWCACNRWPINFHVTGAAGRDHPGAVPTPLVEFIDMAEANPDLVMILAHWGGGLPFFEMNPKIKRILRNVYYDTAASPLLYGQEIFRQMVELIGSEKILFGSDYPLRLYPGKEKRASMSSFIHDIQNTAQLDPSAYAKIMGGNFTRLLFRQQNATKGVES